MLPELVFFRKYAPDRLSAEASPQSPPSDCLAGSGRGTEHYREGRKEGRGGKGKERRGKDEREKERGEGRGGRAKGEGGKKRHAFPPISEPRRGTVYTVEGVQFAGIPYSANTTSE